MWTLPFLRQRASNSYSKKLEGVDKNATEESAFRKGTRYLTPIKVPLEHFKLALDLTAPLTAFEPDTSTVFGVMKGVTAVSVAPKPTAGSFCILRLTDRIKVAISISTADLDFAKKVGKMLEQISYIDDCDTLGEREDRADIHRALVSVYQKLLEFYASAYEFLMQRRTRLVLAVLSDAGTLPAIVKDVLEQAGHLRAVVEKVTFDIVQDIKAMLYNEKISQWLGHDNLSQQSRHHVDLKSLRADSACEWLLEKPEFKSWYGSFDFSNWSSLETQEAAKASR
ncbi:hypothetical protein FPSE5266_20188 [Fusarium pseudograminearum]|nr:hypothetical protein FPSE5266_20188 [Fusarium pseudograminearum]